VGNGGKPRLVATWPENPLKTQNSLYIPFFTSIKSFKKKVGKVANYGRFVQVCGHFYAKSEQNKQIQAKNGSIFSAIAHASTKNQFFVWPLILAKVGRRKIDF